MIRKPNPEQDRLTSGGINLRVYYARAKDGEIYERYYEPISAAHALSLLCDADRFNPIARITRIILWGSWYSYRAGRWTGTSESFALGPFSRRELDHLDSELGRMWEEVLRKADVAEVAVESGHSLAFWERQKPGWHSDIPY